MPLMCFLPLTAKNDVTALMCFLLQYFGQHFNSAPLLVIKTHCKHARTAGPGTAKLAQPLSDSGAMA
jgi:hypothetical protein